MNKLTLVLTLALSATCGFSASYQVPSGWGNDFVAATNQASLTGKPLMMYWGNKNCSNCEAMTKAICEASFVSWVSSHKDDYIFCYVMGEDGKDYPENTGAFEFAWTGAGVVPKDKRPTAYPLICLCRYTQAGAVSAENFTGKAKTMESKAKALGTSVTGLGLGDSLKKITEYYFETILKDTLTFEASGSERDRYEIEPTTTFVMIPVLREGKELAGCTTKLRVEYYNASTKENDIKKVYKIEWGVGETRKMVKVWTNEDKITGYAHKSGESHRLTLFDVNGKAQTTGYAYMVKTPENSPANPLWMGERDEETRPLQAGEWTMDYELAKKRAKSRGKNTFVLVGGSQWCPDCVNTDEYLINTEVFREWAVKEDVSCVAIDIPRIHNALDVPCLLTQGAYVKKDATGKVISVTSGSGYISRKMATEPAGELEAVLARNMALVTNSTENAGLCRPECLPTDWVTNPETGPFKTGIPCLIMMDPEGRILGRLYQFNNVSPTDATAATNYVQRLRELASLEGDPTEEVNRHWSTLDKSCELEHDGGEVLSDISAIDTIDCWRLTGERSVCKDISVTLTADVEDGLVLDILSVDEKTGTACVVKSMDGDATAGLTAEFRAAAAQTYFVRVSVDAQSEAFRLDREGDSRVEYTLSSTATEEPGEPEFTVSEATAGEKGGTRIVYAAVRRVGGASDELVVPVTVDTARSTAHADRYELLTESLTWADGDDQEKSVAIRIIDDDNEDGDEELYLICGESTFVLMLIDNDTEYCGKLGVSAPLYAAEGSVIEVKGIRRDGASGVGSARLKATSGTILDSAVLTWADRESGEMICRVQLPSIDEAETVTFSLVNRVGMDRDDEAKSVTVTLVRSDAPAFELNDISCSATRYVAMKEKLSLYNLMGTSPSCEVVSGQLPPGVLAVVKNGMVVLQGTPTSSGEYKAALRVSEIRKGKTVRGLTANVRCSVLSVAKLDPADPGSNPAVFESSTRTFDSIMVVDREVGLLKGVLTVTVPKTGKVSAKYRCLAGSVSFSATSWSAYDPKNGDLVAKPKTERDEYSLCVRAVRDGKLVLTLTDADGSFDVTAEPQWDGSAENKATDWRGLYTAEFSGALLVDGDSKAAALGNATAVLNMNEKSRWKLGQMNYVVYMPNGQKVSGSTTLARDPDDVRQVLVPIFARADDALGVLSAVPRIMWKGAEQAITDSTDVTPAFVHVDSREAASYELAYGKTAGSVWDEEADLSAETVKSFGTNRLVFEADGLIDEAVIKVNASSLKVLGDNPNGITITLKKETGYVTGSFEFVSGGEVKTASYRGVVLPDWGGCENCGGRPYVSGSCWYSDTFTYKTASGATKTRTVKRGVPFAVEIPQL